MRSNYKSAYVVVSSRIYWKVANEDATDKPQSLADFRKTDSLELIRLSNESWEDVNKIVKVDEQKRRQRITVHGCLHGRTRWNKLFSVPGVQIEIIPETSEQLKDWVQQIRARIAPWNLVEQQVKDAVNRRPSSRVEESGNGVDATTRLGIEPSLLSTDRMQKKWGDNITYLPRQMQKLQIVDDLISYSATTVETGATLTKLITSVKCVAETAEFIADISKCVAGVSTVSHIVALVARGVGMCIEAKRGQRVLPVALSRVVILLRYVLESMTEIMKPSRSANELDREFVFKVLKETLCTMDIAEAQLLRRRMSQIMNSDDVKEVERKVEELGPLVMIASNTSRICAVSQELSQLKKGQEICGAGPHHVPPSVSAFFSGRKKELKTLKYIVMNRGSAVITQYGGAGKTELMAMFADLAVRDKLVPGGVWWVTVDGDERDVVGSLAGLAEKLTRREIGEEERRNPNLVIAGLKQGLGERRGRWLLCLDNADDSKVNGILDEVCGIARSLRGKGWVVVTSRQGQPQVWARMKNEQRLVLEPLCAEDGMVALWRRSRVIETRDADDNRVRSEIRKLERVEFEEYHALKELCGDNGAYSLGGLPLALVQAGTYIAQFKCSFAEYLHFIKCANKDWRNVMNKTEELKSIRESQRSIWTTWKISVEKLSGNARTILRAMAMLGQGGIGEATVKGILKAGAADGGRSVEETLRDVIVNELMHDSSLIWRDETEGEGRRMYMMHRLVRLFILNDVGRGSPVWNDMYSLALLGVHGGVQTELEREGTSFDELPDVFKNNHRELATHALSLVHHHTLPARGSVVRNVSEVEDIHWYTGKLMKFMGKPYEEVSVREHLVDILHHQEEENRGKSRIPRLSKVRRRRNRRKQLNYRIADAYNSLGGALMRIGKLNDAASKLERSLEMRRAIHGRKAHPDIARSLNNLGNVYQALDKLDKALEMHKQSLDMRRTIYGHDMAHSDIAQSLDNLGIVYQELDELNKALEMHEQSLDMRRKIHEHDKAHPNVAASLNNTGNVYQALGKLEKALEMKKQSLNMLRAIHGEDKAHPEVAASLNNLGVVYRALDKTDKALEMLELSLKMNRAIHGHEKAHPDTAKSLWAIGDVYRKQKKLNQALEYLEQSLEMLRVVHGRNSLHPHIKDVSSTLAKVKEQKRRMRAR